MRKIPTPLTLWGSALLTVLMFPILPGCLDTGEPCCQYLDTETIAKGLYIERYRTYCAGVFGESITSYLTDSLHFRQVIGGNDEHGNFGMQLNGNELKTYTTESSFVSDTCEVKTISKADLLTYHHTDTACAGISPIFGINTIQCNNYIIPHSYQTDDGNSITTVQYHCGNDYLNAVLYTDQLKFSVLVGIEIPGDPWSYGVKANTNDTYSFYITETRTVIDTLNVQTFLISDLKKTRLMPPCERRE